MTNKIKSYVGDDLVIECKKLPRMGQNIFIDSDMGKVKIGRIYDIIGAVESPFVVAKIFKENKKYIKSYEELINKQAYFESKNKNGKEKRKRRGWKWKEKRKRKN